MMKKNILLLTFLFVTVPTVSWSMDMMGNEESMFERNWRKLWGIKK